MIKYLSLIVFSVFLLSCATNIELVGSWEETGSKKETIQFHDDGRMEIKQKGKESQSPINFKYEVIDSTENSVNITIFVYNDSTFVKKAKHNVTFKNENTIVLENVDFPDVKPNTYSRKR